VGKTVRIWGLPFTVVGVLRPKVLMGYYEGHDREKVLVPSRTFQAIHGRRHISYLLVGLSSPDNDAAVMQEIYRTLGARKGFDPHDTAALSVHNKAANDRMIDSIVAGIRALIGIVGLFGLLVALIGVANVMYVMVEERRREIGIQMALGARPARVMAAFLFEGLTLTGAGGALGILASAAVLWLFNQVPLEETARSYLGSPVVSLVTALVVTLFLGVAGCAAGYFPARRAATVNPVEALHEE
jgi:putative ABC transport system permease protein